MIKRIIEEIKNEVSDNLFGQFLELLKEEEFGVNGNQDFLKNKYPDIINFYRKQETKNENKRD